MVISRTVDFECIAAKLFGLILLPFNFREFLRWVRDTTGVMYYILCRKCRHSTVIITYTISAVSEHQFNKRNKRDPLMLSGNYRIICTYILVGFLQTHKPPISHPKWDWSITQFHLRKKEKKKERKKKKKKPNIRTVIIVLRVIFSNTST